MLKGAKSVGEDPDLEVVECFRCVLGCLITLSTRISIGLVIGVIRGQIARN